jgi:surface polysaccharide O-acyltransferase-like enzyme
MMPTERRRRLRGKKLYPKNGGISLPADLIRSLAIVLVLVLHAAYDPQFVQQMNQAEVWRWWAVNIYQTVSRTGIPLFVMLSGALLLPEPDTEPLRVFFRKRWNRIGLPFLFWGAAYFAWRFFVNHEKLSSASIIQGILSGPYFHFWYLYMIVGLYLFTPILRIVVSHADRKILKYFVLVWFLGPLIVPLPGLFGAYHLDSNVLTIPWWIGYFMLGAYLLTVRVRRSILLIFLLLGFTSTAVGTYMIAATVGGSLTYFFQGYFSPTTILAAVMLFLLLNTIKAPSNQMESSHSKVSWLLSKISQNTLPIYLFHVMILESLQRGYFGVTFSGNTLNSIIEVPLLAVVTLFICLGVIIILKKIPVLKRAIG